MDKQVWLGLYEDEARWLCSVIERVKRADWREGGDDLFAEMVGSKLANMELLFPCPRRKKKPRQGRR